MRRKILSILVGFAAASVVLGGCFLNTPERVVKRFVGRLKGMQWEKMSQLVDWPKTAEYVPDFPATNKGEHEKKKEIFLRLAENLTGFAVRKKTADEIRHEFLYLRISRLERMKDSKDWAWLEVEVARDAKSKVIQVLVMKINRVWRIVLTENLFK
jgi:hypothetical protein